MEERGGGCLEMDGIDLTQSIKYSNLDEIGHFAHRYDDPEEQ